jgi:ubiquitin-activating enzyme E1
MVENKQEIDMDLYSRQIGTFGMEAMGKLMQLTTLIVGLRGLGVETAKNLILAGPASVTLYDPTVTRINDLGSNFYLTKEHVGKVSRAEASVTQLRELNPHVKVTTISELSPADMKNYKCVVFTENMCGIEQLMEYD